MRNARTPSNPLDGPPQADDVLRVAELDTLAAGADSANPPAVTEQLQAHHTAYYIFTSGTTGLPPRPAG